MIDLQKFALAWGAAALSVAAIAYVGDYGKKAMQAKQDNSNGSIY
jgi:hypothetical protein